MRETIENEERLVEHLLSRINKGIETTVLGMPGMGKHVLMMDLADSLETEDKKTIPLIIKVDVLPKRDTLHFYREMAVQMLRLYRQNWPDTPLVKSLEDCINADDAYEVYNTLRQAMHNILIRRNRKVCIMLYKMSKLQEDASFYTSLATLRRVSKGDVTFIFFDDPALKRQASIRKYEDLYDKILNSIIWMKLPHKSFTMSRLRHWQDFFEFEMPGALQDFIWEQTAGHPSLVKQMAYYFYENATTKYDLSTLVEYYAINSKLERVVNSLGTDELHILQQIAKEKDINKEESNATISSLQSYDLVRETDNGLEVSIRLLSDFLVRGDATHSAMPQRPTLPTIKHEYTYEIEIQDGGVVLNGKKIDEELTNREFRVLDYLIRNRGKIVTREELARTIWGNNYQDKYSDWSLDQAISRLRKKLDDNGYKPQYIKTLRGRGFKLEN